MVLSERVHSRPPQMKPHQVAAAGTHWSPPGGHGTTRVFAGEQSLPVAMGSDTVSHLGYFRQERERRALEFDELKSQKTTTQRLQEQACKLRAEFRDRYDALKAKLASQARRRHLKLCLVILQANVKHKKQERQQAHLAAFCRQKLLHLRKRRLFRAMQIFANWQQQWIKHVRGNFKQLLVKQCFREMYLNACQSRYARRKARLELRRCFARIRQLSQDQVYHRESFARMFRKRRLRTAMDSLQEYTLRKLIEHRNSKEIRAASLRAKQALALKSLARFAQKAKAVKGDAIQEKLLASEAVELDEAGNFVVVEHSQSIDFIPVAALQVSTLTMRQRTSSKTRARPEEADALYGNALNCQQTILTSV